MAMHIELARTMVYKAAWLKDQGKRFKKEAAIAKLYASEICMKACDQAIQIHGGYGYMKEAIELAASNQVKLKQTPLLIHEQGQVAQPFSPRLQTFEAASTPISTGLLAIEANVEVVYEYE